MAEYKKQFVNVETKVRVSFILGPDQTMEILKHLKATAAQAAFYAGFSVAGLNVSQLFDFSDKGGEWIIDVEAYEHDAVQVRERAENAIEKIIKSM